jgi:hypothetical protein
MLKIDSNYTANNHIVLGDGKVFVGQASTAEGLPVICFGALEKKSPIGTEITDIPNPLSFAIVISNKEALKVLEDAVASAKKCFEQSKPTGEMRLKIGHNMLTSQINYTEGLPDFMEVCYLHHKEL